MTNTDNIKLKTINPQGAGNALYISGGDLQHLGVRKGTTVVVDSSIPGILKIMSVATWTAQRPTTKNVIPK